MCSGRLFQATGPATQNARLPSFSLVLGMNKSPRAAERRIEGWEQSRHQSYGDGQGWQCMLWGWGKMASNWKGLQEKKLLPCSFLLYRVALRYAMPCHTLVIIILSALLFYATAITRRYSVAINKIHQIRKETVSQQSLRLTTSESVNSQNIGPPSTST